MSLLADAIEAHGGQTAFDSIDEIGVALRCRGVALPSRGRPRALRKLDARVDLGSPRVRFLDWPRPGQTGVFDGWECRIEERDGVVASRTGRRRRARWDALDVMHFAGYALWNYMTAPFLFARPGFVVEELPGRRLALTFPEDLPTHSRNQVLYLDETNRITRLDYTAEVFGQWAKAAHLCLAYASFEGLLIPTRRRVVPRGPGGRPLPGPTLVGITIDDVFPTRRRAARTA
jgi:hypothetical protein